MEKRKLEEILTGCTVAAAIVGVVATGIIAGIDVRKDINKVRSSYSEVSDYIGPCTSQEGEYFAFEDAVYLKGPEGFAKTQYTAWGDTFTTKIFSGEETVCLRQYSR